MDLDSTSALVNAVCPTCGTVNRLAEDRAAEAHCGKCSQPMFVGHPLEVNGESAERHIARSELPLVLDFWAPWCAPCRTMTPVFESAAQALEPRFRLLKVNTDKEPALSARFGIRGIPTFVILRNGKEVARTSGAMPGPRFIEWVRANT